MSAPLAIVDGTHLCLLPSCHLDCKKDVHEISGISALPLHCIPYLMKTANEDNEEHQHFLCNIESLWETIDVDICPYEAALTAKSALSSPPSSTWNRIGNIIQKPLDINDQHFEIVLVNDEDAILIHPPVYETESNHSIDSRSLNILQLSLAPSSTGILSSPFITDAKDVNTSLSTSTLLLQVNNVSGYFVADFVGNGCEQIVMLPHINQATLSDSTKTDTVEQRKLKLLSILQHSILTDGTDVLYGQNVKPMRIGSELIQHSFEQRVNTFNYPVIALPIVDKNIGLQRQLAGNTQKKRTRVALPPAEEGLDITHESGNSQEETEGHNDIFLKIEQGLRNRLIQQSIAVSQMEQSYQMRWKAIASARDVAYRITRGDDVSCQSRNATQDASSLCNPTPFTRIFQNQTTRSDQRDSQNDRSLIERHIILPCPVKMTQIKWQSFPGSNRLELYVDVLAFPHKTNDSLEKEPPKYLNDVYLSCSCTTLPVGKNLRTSSGVVPILKQGECVSIMACVEGTTFGHQEYIDIVIDAQWTEGGRQEYNNQQLRRGLVLGVVRLPIEAVILHHPISGVEFEDGAFRVPCETRPSPKAVFECREPRILRISSSHVNDLVRDELLWKVLSTSAGGVGRIELNPKCGTISVYGNTPDRRAGRSGKYRAP